MKEYAREETTIHKVPIVGFNTADLIKKLNAVMNEIREISRIMGLSIILHVIFLDGSGFDGSIHWRIKAIAKIYGDACKYTWSMLPDWNDWLDR
jgi:hypothetical protein